MPGMIRPTTDIGRIQVKWDTFYIYCYSHVITGPYMKHPSKTN